MRIEVLYPEVANLYGDLMNVEYLRRSCPEIEVTETHFGEMPRFLSEEVSLVYMGSVTEKGQELIVSELMPHKDRIAERIDAGQAFLVTGNALEIFGQYIASDDGRRFDCLGLFGTHAEQKMMSRYNALYLGSFEGADIVACLFETFSAIATVGLSLSLTPTLSSASKTIIIILMFLGRVGGITVLLSLSGKNKKSGYRLPAENITVG